MADKEAEAVGPDDEVQGDPPKGVDPPVEEPAAEPQEVPLKDESKPFSDSVALGNPGGDSGVEVHFEERRYDVPTVTLPKDHFTLSKPTTIIRYRRHTNAARIIEDSEKQYVLEEVDRENGNHEITIRQLQDSSEGVRFLRFTYALATAFWTGFFFVFCVQIMLFVFLDLAIQFGMAGTQEPSWLAGIGVVLSIFPFIHGLTSGLVIAGVYIVDTARGHPLAQNFFFDRKGKVFTEWVYFFFFLGLPTLALCVTLLTGMEDFWAITGLIWIISILVFFCIFACNVIYFELKACFEVMRNRYPDDKDTYFEVIKRSIYLRQVATYGGYKSIIRVSMGPLDSSEQTDSVNKSVEVPDTRHEEISFRAKLTAWQVFLSLGLYEILEEPQEIYTTDDARDVRPFITGYTWSLEKVFCRPKNSRYIAILTGPGALTRAQMKSSVACSVLGSSMIIFMILSLLIFVEAGTAATLFMLAIAILVAVPNIKSSFRLWKVSKRLVDLRSKCKKDQADRQADSVTSARDLRFSSLDRGETYIGPEESEGLYLTTTRYRVTRPTTVFAYSLFGIEFFFLFFWPLASFFAIGNWKVGILFFVVSGVSAARYYINAALVLEETGHMNLVDGKSEKERWTAQSRLDDIVGNVTRGRSRRAWNTILGVLALVFLALFAGAVGSGQEDASKGYDVPFTYVSNELFQYVQADPLRYPSCSLTADLGDSPLTSMADFAYLAGHAYRGTAFSQNELDQWFGGEVIDEIDLVREVRERVIDSKVSFKLVTTNTGGREFAYLVIRGTTNQWDAMTDAQLWAPAALMQALRIALPFGNIWTPVIPYLIAAITYIESDSLDQISFYKDTVGFVNYLKRIRSNRFKGLAVTGHSLGGGLAIITGAITKTPAVALSGPNTMLSRRSIDPKIDPDDLDRYTFNIVPERDVVPMLDDKAQNYQMIRCQGEYADVVGCHTALRSLCEIMYTCGSGNRPIICECVYEFDYPEPERVTDQNITFDEACAASAAARTLDTVTASGEEL